MTGNLSTSFIRTLVPLLFGSLLTRYGVDPNDPQMAIFLTGAFTYVYYVFARLLEVFGGERWGYILGMAKAPGYSKEDPPAPPPAG